MNEDRPDEAPLDEGGDPACWADMVCDRCGQIVEDEKAHAAVCAK